MKKKRREFPIAKIAVAVAAVVLVGTVLAVVGGGGQPQENVTQPGLEYLEMLENKDPAGVTQILRERREAELEAQRKELMHQVEAGERDPFTLFQDFCIMGDSRAVGFWYFGFVDQARTLTGAGHTIRDITTQMDALVAMNPKYIYLCYGLNDTSIGFWKTAEEYVAEYMEVVADIRQRLPDATVIISSILPARDPAFQRSTKWYNIPEWSAAVEAACQENGIIFVNNDAISEEYADLWDPDGIHVRQAFYPYWATNLILATLQEGGDPVEETGI